jgi:hypothetical protein
MNIIITVDKKHLKKISSIAETLEGLGVSVQRVLKITGVITGSVRGSEKDLRIFKIQGVKSVEKSGTMKGI